MPTFDLSPFNHLLTNLLFVNAPYERLKPEGDLLELFLTNRVRPEIGLESHCLWNEPFSAFKNLSSRLHDAGLECTLHAPFHDLTPGGFDEKIVALSREKLRKAFDLLPLFRPRSIVCHLGYEANKHASDIERWLEVSVETWSELLPLASTEGIPVMFENTYETAPDIHSELFSRLKDHSPRFCLDTGHVLAFSTTPWQDWVQKLGPWLGQLHLHDNDTLSDAHMAVGQGQFDFTGLLENLARTNSPVICTLEIRNREDLLLSLAALDRMNIGALFNC